MIAVQATAYCQAGVTASGYHTRFGQVAVPSPGVFGWLPFGTKIRLRHPVFGRRHFYVRDRIGAWSQLDLFMASCHDATVFGRRTLRYVVETR